MHAGPPADPKEIREARINRTRAFWLRTIWISIAMMIIPAAIGTAITASRLPLPSTAEMPVRAILPAAIGGTMAALGFILLLVALVRSSALSYPASVSTTPGGPWSPVSIKIFSAMIAIMGVFLICVAILPTDLHNPATHISLTYSEGWRQGHRPIALAFGILLATTGCGFFLRKPHARWIAAVLFTFINLGCLLFSEVSFPEFAVPQLAVTIALIYTYRAAPFIRYFQDARNGSTPAP